MTVVDTFITTLKKNVSFFFEKRNQKIALLVASILLVSVLSYGAYRWYSNYREEQAQKVLAESLELFQRAAESDSSVKWSDVSRAFEAGYALYPGSSLAAYFLAFQAESVMQEGDLERAIVLMEKSLAHMPHNSPFYYLYAVKNALMEHDSQDTAVRERGNKHLEELAYDKKNPDRDMALYYLGYFAAAAHNTERARELWTQLVREGSESVWANKAQTDLQALA